MKEALLDIKLLVILFILSALICLFDYLKLLNLPKSLIQTATLPIQYGFYQTGRVIGAQFAFIPAIRQASLQNLALQKQLGEILLENATLRKQLSQTQALVDQQNSLSLKTYNLQAAQIIGLGRYLLINKGFDDGIQVGQVVVFKDNYLGKVIQTSPKVSRVMMPQDPDSKIAAYSQNSAGRARGILLGKFGSEMMMDKILHQESVEVGDLVYSEGMEGELPRGLVLGKVTKIYEKQNEVFKQVEVEPIIKLTDIDVVFIMGD